MKKKWVYVFVFAVAIIGIVLVSSVNLDLNHDGTINVQDLQLLASHYEGKAIYNSSFDLNGDGKVDLFDVVKVARDINVSSNGPGINNTIQPAFEEDWNYTNTSNMQSNPNGWFIADADMGTAANLSLDTGLTTPWGGTKALKLQFYGGGCGSEVSAGKNIHFPTSDVPTGTREMWVEIYTKFESQWKTNFGCSGNPDHKWVFYLQNFWGSSSRWETKIGTDPKAHVVAMAYDASGDFGFGDPYYANYPAGSGNAIYANTWFWDGNWHVVRVHLKAPDPGKSNGEYQMSVDGKTVVNQTGWSIPITSSGGFTGLALGRNLNQHPNQDQAFWFGRVRVWTSNPGWSF